MLGRRSVLTVALASLGTHAFARPHRVVASDRYHRFVRSIRQAASAQGVREFVLDDAFNKLSAPNAAVISRDRHQPESAMTWSEYRSKIITEKRLRAARQNYLSSQELLAQISKKFRVDPGVIVAIWGLESSFGEITGKFNVIDALATLAYERRRRTFFRSELLAALKIMDRTSIPAKDMLGSYAGAMGQPQFMPSAYLRYATDADGDGVADIWTSQADIFASIANFLSHSGWQYGAPWGYEVSLNRPLAAARVGRQYHVASLRWAQEGVTLKNGRALPASQERASIIQPDGATTTGPAPSFMVYNNFNAIRRYNPSDFYALGVGLIADAATTA